MTHDYFAFVASAYGLSALALLALGGWIAADARIVRARLRRVEAGSGRRRAAPGRARP